MKIKKIMAFFIPKALVRKVCDEEWGEPLGVADSLKRIAGSSPLLAARLKSYIEAYEKEASKRRELDREFEAEWREDAKSHSTGCYACDMGNGEGGCTIPGYCPDGGAL